VLGVLALLQVNPMTLEAISAIVLGASLVFSSGMLSRLNSLRIESSGEEEFAKHVARDAVTASVGTEVLVGLSAAVLGVLALVGIAPMTLILVALLAVGASILLSGTALVSRMLTLFAA
jgi:hypothetical protein